MHADGLLTEKAFVSDSQGDNHFGRHQIHATATMVAVAVAAEVAAGAESETVC
jgi:hypothetical protein